MILARRALLLILVPSSIAAASLRGPTEVEAATPTWEQIHVVRIEVRTRSREVRIRLREPAVLIEARGRARPRGADATFPFDGMHAYGTKGQAWTEWLNGSMSLVARAWGAINGGPRRVYGASILPGYDDRHLPGRKQHAYLDRANGALYREQWASATATGADQALVVSFNEWPETTNIEPNQLWGDSYLNVTAEMSAAFRASRA